MYFIYWIAIIGYSKHKLGTINVYFPKKSCHITPLPPYNGHLSTKATFFCPQGGRFGEIQLYIAMQNFLFKNIISTGGSRGGGGGREGFGGVWGSGENTHRV